MRWVVVPMMLVVTGCMGPIDASDESPAAISDLLGKACAEAADCTCRSGDTECRLWHDVLTRCPNPPEDCAQALKEWLDFNQAPAPTAHSAPASATAVFFGSPRSSGFTGSLIVTVTTAANQAGGTFKFTPPQSSSFTWSPAHIEHPYGTAAHTGYYAIQFTSQHGLNALAGQFTLQAGNSAAAQAATANPFTV